MGMVCTDIYCFRSTSTSCSVMQQCLSAWLGQRISGFIYNGKSFVGIINRICYNYLLLEFE